MRVSVLIGALSAIALSAFSATASDPPPDTQEPVWLINAPPGDEQSIEKYILSQIEAGANRGARRFMIDLSDSDIDQAYQIFRQNSSEYGSPMDSLNLIQESIINNRVPVTNDPSMFDHAMLIHRLRSGGIGDDDPEPHSNRLLVKKEGRDRIITIAMQGHTEFQGPYIDELIRLGLYERTEFILPINSALQGSRDSFPDQAKLEDVRAEEFARRNIARANQPKDPIGIFWDYEPRYTGDDGKVVSWGYPPDYSKSTIRLFEHAIDELKRVGYPVSVYGHPWMNRKRPMNLDELGWINGAHRAMADADWIQLNCYPDAIAHLELSDDEKRALAERLHQNMQILEALYPGKPIVPAFFPRHGEVDNLGVMSVYLDALEAYPYVDTIMIWTNPHSEEMAAIFIEKLRDVSEPIKTWLNIRPRDSP